MDAPSGVLNLVDVCWLKAEIGPTRRGYLLQARVKLHVPKNLVRLNRGELDDIDAVDLRIAAGRKFTDFLDNGLGLLIASQRAVDVFSNEKLTGWRTYPIALFDKNDRLLKEKYYIIGITGRAGPLDKEKSVKDWFTEKDGTQRWLRLKGLLFDPKTWDGSDFFVLQDYGAVLVNGKVLDVLKQAKLTGWEAISVKKWF